MRVSTCPGRVKLMISNAFYICASSSLFLAYLTSYFGPAQWTFYGKDDRATWATDELVSIFGAINAVCWLLGFAIMIDWLTYDDVKRHPGHVERGVLWGVILKEIASVLFNVQPWSYLIDKNSYYLKPGTGVPWSNFVGVVFYLTGNCVEFLFLLRHYDHNFQHKNWPIYGTFMAVAANWFICTANAYEYFNLAGTWWSPPRHPSVAPYQRKLIIPFQITGALLLLFGTSWLFLYAYTAKPWEDTVVDGKIVGDKKKNKTTGAVSDPDLYEALTNGEQTEEARASNTNNV